MKSKIILPLVIIIALIACKKDKYTTEPKIDVRSITPDVVSKGNIVEVRADFTDDEGDLDSVNLVRKRFNGVNVISVDTFRNSLASLNIPEKTRKGELLVQLAYGENIPGYVILPSEINDTENAFGFVLIDKMGQRSNYDESSRILLKKP